MARTYTPSPGVPPSISPAVTGGVGIATGEVRDKLGVLSGFASSSLTAANTAMNTLATAAAGIKDPKGTVASPGDVAVSGPDFTARPGLGDLNTATTWPDVPPAKTIVPVDVTGLDAVRFPLFTAEYLGFEPPDKPDYLDPTTPGNAPTPRAVDLPGIPSIQLPAIPTIQDIVIPPAPEIDIPEFDAQLMPWNIDEPGYFSWSEPVYNSDIWSDLLAKVLDGIKNGGTGLDAQVEEDIYWQHLNRTFHENEKMVQQAENHWAARGFTMPPGMLSAQINEIYSQVGRNNLQASKDITINQAELAQKNTHFILDKGTQLEGMMREFFINQANMALQGQRAVAEHAIAIYNAKVQKQQLLLEEYKTKAQVWESQVKAVLTEIEVYKGQIEGARVTAEVQKSLVDIYTAQVGAAKTYVDLYVAQLQGAQTELAVQELEVKIYGEGVKAYVAQIEANRTMAQLYATEMEGEKAKVEVYKSQVDAFGSEVAASSEQLRGIATVLQTRMENNKLLIAEYTATIQGFAAEVDAKAKEVGAKVSGFQALATAYTAETQRDTAWYQAQVAQIQAEIAGAELGLRHAIAQVEAATRSYLGANELKLSGMQGVATVGAQLAASAMNAINVSASMSYSGSESKGDSTSTSLGFSRSSSGSMSENQNYFNV